MSQVGRVRGNAEKGSSIYGSPRSRCRCSQLSPRLLPAPLPPSAHPPALARGPGGPGWRREAAMGTILQQSPARNMRVCRVLPLARVEEQSMWEASGQLSARRLKTSQFPLGGAPEKPRAGGPGHCSRSQPRPRRQIPPEDLAHPPHILGFSPIAKKKSLIAGRPPVVPSPQGLFTLATLAAAPPLKPRRFHPRATTPAPRRASGGMSWGWAVGLPGGATQRGRDATEGVKSVAPSRFLRRALPGGGSLQTLK